MLSSYFQSSWSSPFMDVMYFSNLLSKTLQKAVKWGLIQSNPAKGFLKVCEAENCLVLFLLALFTGMRRGEILALRWNNVDLEKGVIHVAEALA